MRKLGFFYIATLLLLIPKTASAHCPLCVVGAGALAVFASSIGVSSVVVGILIGAFALALGFWVAPMIKKEFIPYQKQILILLIYVGTIIPVMPFIKDYGPLYVSLGGEYGSLWHNTYTVDLFLFGSILGATLMFVAPFISKAITKARGRQVLYQGIIITFSLLIITSVIFQLIKW
ncbi:hypothetical protein KKH05_00250 [Patescibacteria group bacterium]|nr:hypothetical protein [Patescibacteria group bacterium]